MNTASVTRLFFCLFILFATSHVSAQNTATCDGPYLNDALLQKLTGTWAAKGSIGDDKIGYNISAEWVLNHQFVEMTLADTAAVPQYTAKVFIGYDCVSERYVAHWIDNFGARMSLTPGYGTGSLNAIEFRFEYPDGPFINKFTYDEKRNQWQLFSTTKNKKGVWVTFGDILLQRK